MAIPKQRRATNQHTKSTALRYPSNGPQLTSTLTLTVRDGVAVPRLVWFSVSLYLVSLYKCGPVRLFSGPR